MHRQEFVYRAPDEAWHHFATSYLRLNKHRVDSKKRMRRYRKRRAQARHEQELAYKDEMQHKLERVFAGTEEWEPVACSSAHLRAHIESQFVRHMGWHNQDEWYVEYVVPRCAFAKKHQQQAFHYSNLRPAWGRFGFPTYTRSRD